jgi:multidomain signaling protein FimX
MAELKDISVLFAHDSADDASRVTSVLDNSGYRVRAYQANTKEALANEIKNNSLDVILGQMNSSSLPPKTLLQEISRLNKDVPVILINPTHDNSIVAQGIRLGAKDVVAEEEDQRLIAVVNREIQNREDRAAHRDTQRKFYTSENRYQQLLQFARLPLAIVQDSMFVMANEAFAELFNLPHDEIEEMPFIDLLDKAGQQSFKELYKDFVNNPDAFNGAEILTKTGESTESIKMELNSVKYNDEDCLQIRVEPKYGMGTAAIAAENSNGGDGLLPRHKVVQHISSAINMAHQESQDSCLFCIEIDAFDKLQETLGIGFSDELYHALIAFVEERFKGKAINNFETNRLLLLLDDTDAESAVTQGKKLCAEVEQTVLEFGDHSQQITIRAGIALISDLITNADVAIKQAIRGCEQLAEAAEDEIVNTAGLFEPEGQAGDQEVDINYLLKQAFKHTHLQILFQPLMHFHGEEGKHYEVLLGIRPEHKETYPPDFIAMACRSNENHEIDRWVILEALRTLMKKTNGEGDETLFIHVSKQSLQNDQFAAWLHAAVKKSRLDPKQIVFQFREVDVSSFLKASGEVVSAIKKAGCRTAITHFGTSVQPMKILDTVPFDFVKVDGSFTLAAQKSANDIPKLVELLDQIKDKGRLSIVPMVENTQILPSLWKSSVAFIQGYYVRQPTDKMDFSF